MTNINMIDKIYWLNYAKEHITAAITTVNEAANKLENFLVSIWGIYTSLFALALAFNVVTDDICIRIVLALPVIFLPIARYMCIHVQMPVFVQFYYDEPDSIEADCYVPTIKTKNRRMKAAKAMSLVSVLSVCIALLVFKVRGNDENYLVYAYNATGNNIVVNGRADAGKEVSLIVLAEDSSLTQTDGKPLVRQKTGTANADASGKFQASISMPGIKRVDKVLMQWNDGKNVKVITAPQAN